MKVFVFCSLLALLPVFLSCAKTAIKDDTVHPIVKASITLQVARFVNSSKDPSIDIYKEAIPNRIVQSLSSVKQVKFPLDYEIISNKDAVLKRQEELKNIKKAYSLKRIDDFSIVSYDVKDKEDREGDSTVNDMYDSINAKGSKVDVLKDYLLYYNKTLPKFPEYLGLPVNKKSKIKQMNVQSGLFSVAKGEKVFSADTIYSSLGENSAIDLLLLGSIKKASGSLTISIALFDKYKRDFVLRKSFSISSRDIELMLNKQISIISDFIISYLTSYPKATLTVKTKPKGALVFIDDNKFAISPVTKKLAQGLHKISILKEGYKKVAGNIYVNKGKKQTLSINLTEQIDKGSIIVTSEPPGADIYFDMDYKGTSPLILDKVIKGIYKIRLEKEGYKYLNTVVDVKKGENLKLFFPLEEGDNVFKDVEVTSRPYNIAKNIFLYGSLVSLSSLIYAALYEDTYLDRLKSLNTSSIAYAEYFVKYKRALGTRNATLYTTIGLVVLTILFQSLELYYEDINVVLSIPSTSYMHRDRRVVADIALQFGLKF